MSGVSAEAPVGEGLRTAGRLLGALALVAVVTLLTAVAAVWVRAEGGFDLGTSRAAPCTPSSRWPRCCSRSSLALLAVAVGAAAGRRLRHRATADAAALRRLVPVRDGGAGPSRAGTSRRSRSSRSSRSRCRSARSPPTRWTSRPRGCSPSRAQYQDHWARQFVSGQLATAHDVWLLGLTCLFLAVAVPRRRRASLLAPGRLLAAAGVALAVRGDPVSRALVALLLAVLATGCTAAYDNDGEARSSGRMAPAPAKAADAVPVVVDSDLAPDDLAAITYLLRHPRVRVVGITVPTTGHGHLSRSGGLQLLADLFAAIEAQSVPVACGVEPRSDGAVAFPEAWCRGRGASTADCPTSAFRRTPRSARAPPTSWPARRRPLDDLHVVALGPLTELAAVRRDHPAAYRRIAGITTMAGIVDAESHDAGPRRRRVERRRRPGRLRRRPGRTGAGHGRPRRPGAGRAAGRDGRAGRRCPRRRHHDRVAGVLGPGHRRGVHPADRRARRSVDGRLAGRRDRATAAGCTAPATALCAWSPPWTPPPSTRRTPRSSPALGRSGEQQRVEPAAGHQQRRRCPSPAGRRPRPPTPTTARRWSARGRAPPRGRAGSAPPPSAARRGRR